MSTPARAAGAGALRRSSESSRSPAPQSHHLCQYYYSPPFAVAVAVAVDIAAVVVHIGARDVDNAAAAAAAAAAGLSFCP